MNLILPAIQALFSSVDLLGGNHLDEHKDTGQRGIGVPNNLAFLDGTRDWVKRRVQSVGKKAGSHASDERDGMRTDGITVIVFAHGLVLDGTGVEG